MSDVLEKIAAYKRLEVAARKESAALEAVEMRLNLVSPPRGFAMAIVATPPGPPALIAEIKKASPSRGLIREAFDPPALARAYAEGGAACLSILTDNPSFQGDDAYLAAARAACVLPCLRKEFLIDPWQVAESRSLGADAILIIMAMVDDVLAAALIAEADRLGMDALVEVHDEEEMKRAGDLGATLVGINNRDLRTFEVDLAVTERLAPLAPPDAVLVGESGIFTPADAERLQKAGIAAMLVGESLMRQPDVTAATKALLGRV